MIEEKIYSQLEKLNITFGTHNHAPAFTCAQMEELRKGLPPFGEMKNLFLKDKRKNYYLLTASYTTTINLKALAQSLPAPELRFARPDELESILGVTPGSVTLFALINDTSHQVKVLLDKTIFDHDTIGLHPLRNDMTTIITPHDAEKFITALGYSYSMV